MKRAAPRSAPSGPLPNVHVLLADSGAAMSRPVGCAGGWRLENQNRRPSRQAVPCRGDLWGGKEHRPGVGLRSALRRLARRTCTCLSAANKACCTARPQAKRRSAIGAKPRPPHHEPLPGTAWRDVQSMRAKRALADSRGGPVAICCRPPSLPHSPERNMQDALRYFILGQRLAAMAHERVPLGSCVLSAALRGCGQGKLEGHRANQESSPGSNPGRARWRCGSGPARSSCAGGARRPRWRCC